jgi:hypothetical protein
MRYHLRWKHRDLDGVMALYHPDYPVPRLFQNRVIGHAELREYVRSQHAPCRRRGARAHRPYPR